MIDTLLGVSSPGILQVSAVSSTLGGETGSRREEDEVRTLEPLKSASSAQYMYS